MCMNRHVCFAFLESKRIRLALQQVFHKFLKQEATLRDLFRAFNFQLTIIFDEHRPAGRLEENEGRRAVRRVRKLDIMPPHMCGGVEISLTESRSAATFPIYQEFNFEPERCEHLHRGNPDVRFVISNKRVIPEDHFAARRTRAVSFRISREPTIEPFARVMREGTLRGNAKVFFHETADRPKMEN